MNQIELIINEHNAKVHPEVPTLAQSLGLPSHTSNQQPFRHLSRNKQLLLVAEYEHFIQIRDSLAHIAPLDPATWPEQFDALAKTSWEQTVGTALEYFENPASLGYCLLAAATSVIFPTLTPEQRMDKLVRGENWGIHEWVKLKLVNQGDAYNQKKGMHCHAELAVEPSTGLTSCNGVVTDGCRALDAANLLESFALHLPNRLAQRLLKAFMSELKQQYPSLYKALRHYNADTSGLLSYLDQTQTPREALEELRNVFFADAKLLTGNLYASERSHQATAVFIAYLDSIAYSEREALYKLKSGHRTLKKIVEGINAGMCVELAAGEINKLLCDPVNAASLDRIPQQPDATSATTPTWKMTNASLLLERGLLLHEIPHHFLESVLLNLRNQVGNHSGIWLATLMNLINPREHEQLFYKVLSRLSTAHILTFFSKMQLPKQITILEAMDKWKSVHPFANINDFAQLVYAFEGTKSELLTYLSNTLTCMQWSIENLCQIMQSKLSAEIKIILQPVAKTILEKLNMMVTKQASSDEGGMFFDDTHDLIQPDLLQLLVPNSTIQYIKAYTVPALGTGQLGQLMISLDEKSLAFYLEILKTCNAWNEKIINEFEEFAAFLSAHLTHEDQETLWTTLLTTHGNTLLKAIIATENVSNLCSALEDRELYAAASILWGVVEDNFLEKQNFKLYASRLIQMDFEYLIDLYETKLIALMQKDSEWLAAVIENSPAALAKAMWDKVSGQDGIQHALKLSTINTLYEILPRDAFERLFPQINNNILASFSDVDLRPLAQFACHALRHEQSLSLWLILQQDVIGTSLERMHNLLMVLAFLAKHAGNEALPDDTQLIEDFLLMHCNAAYSDYFDLLRAQGHENAAIQLRTQLASQIRTIKDIEFVQKRCNALDSNAILTKFLPVLGNQCLRGGDFAKLVAGVEQETVLHVWQALQPQPILSVINLVDLRVIADALSAEALHTLCTSLQGRAAEMVNDIISFHFAIKGLAEDKQQILLEWAQDTLRPMIHKPMHQTHLLLNLSPAMQAQWRPRLPIFKKGPGQQGVFSAPPSQIMTTEAPPVPSPPK